MYKKYISIVTFIVFILPVSLVPLSKYKLIWKEQVQEMEGLFEDYTEVPNVCAVYGRSGLQFAVFEYTGDRSFLSPDANLNPTGSIYCLKNDETHAFIKHTLIGYAGVASPLHQAPEALRFLYGISQREPIALLEYMLQGNETIVIAVPLQDLHILYEKIN